MSNWPAPRALLQREWPAFRAAVNRIFRPSGGDLTDELPLLFGEENRDNLRVIATDDGQILAHAGALRREALVFARRATIGFIGAVFTDPAVRGQRLATRVLRDALERTRPGADMVLASGDRDLYRRQGFEPAAPLARFRLPGRGAAAASYELRALAGDAVTDVELGELRALHDAEPVHLARSEADWRRLLAAARLVDSPASFTRVVRGGRTIAFLAAQQEAKRPDGTMRPRRILELAGDRDAIIDVAGNVADELLVPSYDSATITRAVARGWTRTVRQFPITAEPLTPLVSVVPWYGLNYV